MGGKESLSISEKKRKKALALRLRIASGGGELCQDKKIKARYPEKEEKRRGQSFLEILYPTPPDSKARSSTTEKKTQSRKTAVHHGGNAHIFWENIFEGGGEDPWSFL